MPSGNEETLTPVMSCVAEVTLPLPLTEVAPLLPLLVTCSCKSCPPWRRQR